ncbi:GntR family transcriptional regulator [Streptacidiphilus jiangxiensis]|uniref:GntR family transcriptional regulator n=1 Tax=Streptacidiphilus jiangxiensis TaxID=235985 RepID=A0A1H8AHP2_STRJI|nr:GntR family transcriptional regulator [Streptacidiphilus jiangxiensis]SEM69329.1 GntR family transcriptional regulator [Streptacidiphilus jiangxiensis]SEM75970.1 GntR family transcriptional regulator [Streptacidiphilus jiangxiensis]
MTQVPLFRRIADALRDAILSGELAPGEPIPSEHELAARFETTRVTVRKAIALLKADGLLATQQGKPTTVRPRPAVQMLTTGANWRRRRSTGEANYNAEAAAQGHVARQELRSVEHVPMPAEISARFDVPEGTPAIVRRLRYLVDDEPMQLVNAYYLAARFSGTPVEEQRRIRGGVSALIEDPAGPIRQRFVQFVEELEIRMPWPDERDLLAIPDGVPLARVFRVGHAASGEILEVLDSRMPGDRHSFQFVIDIP